MGKFSVKTKFFILILLMCGTVLFFNNKIYASNSLFDITHYRRNLVINQQNEKGLRKSVIKLPLINKTKQTVTWISSNPNIAIVNDYRICNRIKTRNSYNYCSNRQRKHI